MSAQAPSVVVVPDGNGDWFFCTDEAERWHEEPDWQGKVNMLFETGGAWVSAQLATYHEEGGAVVVYENVHQMTVAQTIAWFASQWTKFRCDGSKQVGLPPCLQRVDPGPREERSDSPYFNAREAAAYLRMTLKALYNHVERKRLKPLGSGRRYRFTKEQLDAFLERRP